MIERTVGSIDEPASGEPLAVEIEVDAPQLACLVRLPLVDPTVEVRVFLGAADLAVFIELAARDRPVELRGDLHAIENRLPRSGPAARPGGRYVVFPAIGLFICVEIDL